MSGNVTSNNANEVIQTYRGKLEGTVWSTGRV